MVQLAPVPRHTNESAITIVGSTAANAAVEVAGGAALATGTADAQGNFSVSVPLKPNQVNNLSVVAINRSGIRSDAVTATVIHDDIAPDPVDLEIPTHTTNDLLTMAGSTEAGATVIANSPIETVETTAAGSGAFSLAVRLALNTANEISVVARDSAGNQSAAYVGIVIHDDVPPTVTVDAPAYTSDDPLTLTGTTDAGATVTAESPVETVETTADGSGAFSLAVRLSLNMANEITLAAQDAAGNEGPEVVVVVLHDNVVPALTIHSPSAATFDTDGDLCVNIDFSYDDGEASGVDLTSIIVTNDRDIGGGSGRGGMDAGLHLLPPDAVGPTNATYNMPLAHEFPTGTNTLTVGVADLAGNTRTETVEFTVSGTHPSFAITQPTDGGAPPVDGFAIVSEFSDIAGTIDEGSLTLTADEDLFGLLSQDGTQRDGVPAGQNLGPLFSTTDGTAEFPFGSSYAFSAGAMTITGQIADRAGNNSPADAVTFTFPPIPHTLLVVNSTAAPGADAHVVSVGLTNFTSLGGVQFTLQFDASVLTVSSVSSTGRVPFAPFYEQSVNGDVAELKVVLVDLGGDPIPAGSGIVVDIAVSVSADAAVQDVALTIIAAEMADVNGNPLSFVVQNGVVMIR